MIKIILRCSINIAALIAPRRLMIETGDQDPLNGRERLENVYKPLRVVKRAYKIHNSLKSIKHLIHHGTHKWYGVGVPEWLKMV